MDLLESLEVLCVNRDAPYVYQKEGKQDVEAFKESDWE